MVNAYFRLKRDSICPKSHCIFKIQTLHLLLKSKIYLSRFRFSYLLMYENMYNLNFFLYILIFNFRKLFTSPRRLQVFYYNFTTKRYKKSISNLTPSHCSSLRTCDIYRLAGHHGNSEKNLMQISLENPDSYDNKTAKKKELHILLWQFCVILQFETLQ